MVIQSADRTRFQVSEDYELNYIKCYLITDDKLRWNADPLFTYDQNYERRSSHTCHYLNSLDIIVTLYADFVFAETDLKQFQYITDVVRNMKDDKINAFLSNNLVSTTAVMEFMIYFFTHLYSR